MDAILNINKQPGWTSFDVVAKVRRIMNEKRVGHAGTLDPFATGVLPVYIGTATSLIQYSDIDFKRYRATVCFGAETDTYDVTGNVVSKGDASSATKKRLEELLPRYTGRISQVPPAYSALKIGGTSAYKLARRGNAPVMAAREVDIYAITIVEWRQGETILDVECGSGTYIRSLAHDIGQDLGCGAHLTALERRAVGPFQVEQARTVDEVAASFASGRQADLLLSADFPLRLPRLDITPEQLKDLRFGRTIVVKDDTHGKGPLYSAYLAGGAFMGILRRLPAGDVAVVKLIGASA
ncbi:MAG: tRNA pseudouridine(55) synthase TruB [Dehalococcoidia bacterium]|nr:tRNA pseudouridine(55) synthase TruB [Dehalococcoidia bacterium]